MENKLVSLIAGPTDRTKIFRFSKISETNYQSHLEHIAKTLARFVSTVNLIPDQGVPLDFAQEFRRHGGTAIGYVPQSGFEVLTPNFEYCDKIEEFEGKWSALNTCLCLKGDLITVIGMSPGTLVEVAYTKYHRRYVKPMPVLIDAQTVTWILPKQISEELDVRYFRNTNELETQLRELQKSK